MNGTLEEPQSQEGRRHPFVAVVSSVFGVAVLAAIACLILVIALNAPPTDFPVGARVEIESGATLADIAVTLKEHRVVASEELFQLMATMKDVGHEIYAGVYIFPKRLSTLEVVEALITKENLLPAIRITVPEGSTLADIDVLAHDVLGLPDSEITRVVGGEEGLLFPDTYFVDADMTGEALVALLGNTQRERLLAYQERINASGFSEKEVLILASILEREGNDETSMKVVSGILQKRLAMDMPLQVDATFAYLLHKSSGELTNEDLAIDSPLNTYRYRGLPPAAIGNPGLLAIESVLEPTASEYLYYLSDADGNFHYARTFDEHKQNKARYLR